MAVGLLIAKLVLTPAVIAFVSWVERRFGPALAGLVNGLPLTSALTAAFLAHEQGAAFTRGSVPGMLAGIVALGAFLLGFAWASRWGRWWLGLAGGIGLYLPTALALAAWPLRFQVAAPLAVTGLVGAALLMPPRPRMAGPRPHGAWELPLRIVVGTTLVVGLTAAAAGLGPNATGLLLLFPAVTSVLCSFVLARAGRPALLRMTHGMAVGCLAFVAFFVVIGASLGTMPVALTFTLASLAALGASAVTWRLAVSRADAPSPAGMEGGGDPVRRSRAPR